MILVLIDGEIGPTKLDLQMLEWLRSHERPFTVVATKHDKVKSSRARAAQAGCRRGGRDTGPLGQRRQGHRRRPPAQPRPRLADDLIRSVRPAVAGTTRQVASARSTTRPGAVDERRPGERALAVDDDAPSQRSGPLSTATGMQLLDAQGDGDDVGRGEHGGADRGRHRVVGHAGEHAAGDRRAVGEPTGRPEAEHRSAGADLLEGEVEQRGRGRPRHVTVPDRDERVVAAGPAGPTGLEGIASHHETEHRTSALRDATLNCYAAGPCARPPSQT